MKYVVLAVALLSSVPAYASQGDVYNKECESTKTQFCPYSYIQDEEQKAPGVYEVLVLWNLSAPKTFKSEKKQIAYNRSAVDDKLYVIDCNNGTVSDARVSTDTPINVNETDYAWPKSGNPEDMIAAWHTVCKK